MVDTGGNFKQNFKNLHVFLLWLVKKKTKKIWLCKTSDGSNHWELGHIPIWFEIGIWIQVKNKKGRNQIVKSIKKAGKVEHLCKNWKKIYLCVKKASLFYESVKRVYQYKAA